MRGLGGLLDLLLFALAMATLVGWIYLWYLCVSSAEKLLKPLFGENALAVACIGFPFAFFGLLGLALKLFGREAGTWVFVTLGALLPALGIWAIRTDRFR